MKKHTSIFTLSKDELTKKATELRLEMQTVSRGIKMGDVQNVRIIKHKRRELARVLTAQNRLEAKAVVTTDKKGSK